MSNAQGHFCQLGSAWPAPCHQGEYQPSLGSDTCLSCPPGFHCPHPGIRMPRLCPAHAYCPTGKPRALKSPCIPGPQLSPQHLHLSFIHSFIIQTPWNAYCMPSTIFALGMLMAKTTCIDFLLPSFLPQAHPTPLCRFSFLHLLTHPCSMSCPFLTLSLGVQGEHLDQDDGKQVSSPVPVWVNNLGAAS